MTIDPEKLEKGILELGSAIFNEAQDSTLSAFDPEFHTGKLINWAMEDDDFRVSLFRFVDVLPSLVSASDVIEHVHQYFRPVADRIPSVLKWGLNIKPHSVASKVTAQIVRQNIRSIAKKFILGDNHQTVIKQLKKIRKQKMAFTVDILGEATVSEHESLAYLERYVSLIEALSSEVPNWSESSPIIEGHKGETTPLNISVKLSALYSQVQTVSFRHSVGILQERFSEILKKARTSNTFVYLDMEDASYVPITLEVFKSVLGSSEFKDYDKCGIVIQAYLRRSKEDLQDLISWVHSRATPIAVRLVKGAYWDTEVTLAKQHSWPVPVWQQKAATDKAYEELSVMLLKNHNHILTGFASHNIRSLCHAIQVARHLGVDETDFELQALYGMAEPIKKAFVDRGFLVREYAPIGELISGMSYLVRRLLENTSNEGFLRQSFHEHESPNVLLAKPIVSEEDSVANTLTSNTRTSFTNTPLRDFSVSTFRDNLGSELAKSQSALRESPEIVKPIINGDAQDTSSSINSVSPEDINFVLAKVELADTQLAQRAVTELSSYFPIWRDTDVAFRMEILFKAAQIIEQRREELTSLIILETGKQWIEADADVAEAIDFLNYYAFQAKPLFKTRQMGSLAGEHNTYFYEPRGVAVVISPWNFPLAIPCGMFSAALVTGNCVILKPAEQASLVASRLFDIFLQAGLPAEAASFLPGIGEGVGWDLVNNPHVVTVCFTGSKAVGLKLISHAARVSEGQEHVKKVIAEMGGKNAIIVDSDADLDVAVKCVVSSAFSYQGQKCSACSRAIVLESIYEKFTERLACATQSIIVGPASEPHTYVGPVIDTNAFNSIRAIIEKASKDCELLAVSNQPMTGTESGNYILPTVFTNVPEGHEILSQEIFGPVLACIKVKTFDDALAVAMNSEYGLAGAVLSRSPKNIEKAKLQFRVGNLYINRGCTGALVMRQPFGGAKMSGVGSKAGGPDYLHQFVIPRAVTENTMRRGFVPDY